MKLHRFYINQKIQGDKLRIDDSELLNQWGKVFRLKAGNRVVIFDGTGFEYEAEFELLTKKEAVLKIGEKKIVSEPTKKLHIFQSIIKKDNFELIVQKCTEIGASAFHPIISERSEKKDLNIERLQKIAKEASEQSGKGRVPEIFTPVELAKAIENFDGELFVLDFDGEKLSSLLTSVIPAKAGIQESEMDPVLQRDDRKHTGVIIGPEGG